MVGQSETGSGKTAAFCIPAIERVDAARRGTQALILVPTRELATQVADEVHKLAAFKKGVRSVPIYGGASYERQFAELGRGAHIVVGTPGRLTDLLDRGALDLSAVRMLVLDEADRMLDMGFREDIEKILAAAPAERQTVFFSATISPAIQALVRGHSRDPKIVTIEQRVVAGPPLVDQVYYEVRHHAKFEALCPADRLLRRQERRDLLQHAADGRAARRQPSWPAAARPSGFTAAWPRPSGRGSWPASRRRPSPSSSPPTWRPAASTSTTSNSW